MKIPVTTRKFILIVLSVYFGILASIFGILVLSSSFTAVGVWNGLVYPGIVVFILGFLLIGSKGGKWSGAARASHMQSDVEFEEWRKREKPFELIAWALISAAILIMVTGFLLARLMV